MRSTDQYEGMIAETITIPGHGGDDIDAYFARPLGAGPFPGVVLIHHMPGWDEWYREATRKLRPPRLRGDLPQPLLPRRPRHARGRRGQGPRRGRRADDQVVGDLAGALHCLRALPYANGKVGVIGTCSGGRHAYLAACRAPGFDAVVDCWGGGVVPTPEELTPRRSRSRRSTTPRTCRARCSASSATTTQPRRPSRSTSTRRS